MWRMIGVFVLGGILGLAGGIGIGFFIFPYVFPPPPAAEQLAANELTAVVARGQFIHANPNDPVHYGSGGVTVLQNTVFLEGDFEVGPGPKYRVYLVSRQSIRSSGEVKESDVVDLGGLRAFRGSQKYPIPANINLADYPSVVIWCAAFGVLISPADLQFL